MRRSVLLRYLRRPQNLLYRVLCGNPHLIKNDKQYLKMRYSICMGRRLNLENPVSFNEKLQWLKLFNRCPEYTMMVDKYAVKEYVSRKIGIEYVIPTLGVWDKPSEIDWDSLPAKFVLKTTHDSGGIVICRDKTQLNKVAAINKLEYAITHDNYSVTREWPYKNVRRRIIAEQYIEPDPKVNDLPDYKFFCFDGEVKALFVATERQNPNEEVKFDFFDADFNSLPIRQGHNHAKILPRKPDNFEQMKQIAETLSFGIPHVRVDLYNVNGEIYFGELTFFHFGGFTPFEPDEWDVRFGNMLSLPSEKRE